MFRAAAALGSAMLTMVASRITINWAIPITISAIHRFGSSSWTDLVSVRSVVGLVTRSSLLGWNRPAEKPGRGQHGGHHRQRNFCRYPKGDLRQPHRWATSINCRMVHCYVEPTTAESTMQPNKSGRLVGRFGTRDGGPPRRTLGRSSGCPISAGTGVQQHRHQNIVNHVLDVGGVDGRGFQTGSG